MIGPRLRHIRQEKGFTVESLATAAGLDKGFLSRLERGTKRPSIETVLRLSAALDVPVGQLFGEQTTEDTVRVSRAAGRARFDEGGGYSFELLTPDRSYVLEAGDCAHFPGHLAHSMRRIGPAPAKAIIAVARSERYKT